MCTWTFAHIYSIKTKDGCAQFHKMPGSPTQIQPSHNHYLTSYFPDSLYAGLNYFAY